MTPQIHKKSRSVILPAGMQPFVADLPHKSIELDGKKLVAVKHDLETHPKLIEAGVEVPHPIQCYYEWPRLNNEHPPMPHQKIGAEFMVSHKRCFNLSEPRTGKTFTCLLAADYLKSHGYVRKVVIFSTLSTVEIVWAQAIFDSFGNYTYTVVHGTPDRRREALGRDVDFYIINHDGAKDKVYQEWLRKRKDIDLIIWDEADVLSNAQSAMWKEFRDSLQPHMRLWLLTGTPTGERPTSAWAMTKLVSPDNVPKYFGAFRSMVMHQVTQFKWVPKKDANAIVHKVMQPAICFRKSDVLDLPALDDSRIECKMSEQQKKLFESMRKDMQMEAADGEKITAINASDKVLKLLQIALGAYKIGEGEYQDLDCQDRVQKILDCIGTTPQKAIVFVSFTGAMKLYFREISKHYKCAMVYGDTPKKERDKIFTSFQNSNEPHVILAHPATTAHGIEMAAADKIIWAAPAQRGVHFLQANERIASAKQKHPMTIYYIGSTAIEWKRYDALINKRDDQSALLDLYKEVIAN